MLALYPMRRATTIYSSYFYLFVFNLLFQLDKIVLAESKYVM